MHSMLPACKLGYNQKTFNTDERIHPDVLLCQRKHIKLRSAVSCRSIAQTSYSRISTS